MMDAPKKPEVPKKPEMPKKPVVPNKPNAPHQGNPSDTSGRDASTRSRLGWKIYCTKCNYINGTTNYEGARKSALDRLKRSNKACPECGSTAWDSAEIYD